MDERYAEYGRVCIVHLAFVPCRHGEPGSECFKVVSPSAAVVVGAYQRSNLTEREARAFFDNVDYEAQRIDSTGAQ